MKKSKKSEMEKKGRSDNVRSGMTETYEKK